MSVHDGRSGEGQAGDPECRLTNQGKNSTVEIHNPKSRPEPPEPNRQPGLSPTEIIHLGISQGHSADVIIASLKAAGWVCVPLELTRAMERAGSLEVSTGIFTYPDGGIDLPDMQHCWDAMLAARPLPNRQPAPTAYEEAPGSCKWEPFRRGNIEGIRRVELDKP